MTEEEWRKAIKKVDEDFRKAGENNRVAMRMANFALAVSILGFIIFIIRIIAMFLPSPA